MVYIQTWEFDESNKKEKKKLIKLESVQFVMVDLNWRESNGKIEEARIPYNTVDTLASGSLFVKEVKQRIPERQELDNIWSECRREREGIRPGTI